MISKHMRKSQMKEITKEEFEEKYKDYPEVYDIDETSMYESCIKDFYFDHDSKTVKPRSEK